MKQEFYIGYLPKMPKSLANIIRLFLVLAFASAFGLAVVLWTGQKFFANSFFEFGSVKDFEGTIQAKPIPFLLIPNGGTNDGLPRFERLPLVAEGKHGAAVDFFDGSRVKLKGTLIYRNDLRMIELVSDSIEKVDDVAVTAENIPQSLGNFTLRGEIVDSKCYLGVMNPGESKPHRDCAVACLRGGIPPLFIVKDHEGSTSELWLISHTGEALNSEILDFVAEPVEMSGEVKRAGDQLFLYSDPQTVKRLK